VTRPPFSYSALPTRPRLELPNGARIAVWVAVNVEHFAIDQPGLSIVPVTAGFVPDPMNYGWRDYGARVGTWRLADLLERHGFPVSAPVHSSACERYPELIEEGNRRGFAWIAHGVDDSQKLTGIDESAERAFLSEMIDTVELTTGRRPKGWLGPALTETFNTPRLLSELGLKYVLDWCNDDQPYRLDVPGMLSVPYTIELNDVTVFLAKSLSGAQWHDMIVDQFDALHAAGEETAQVMCIALHGFLAGVPFRLRHLEAALEHIAGADGVWLTTSDEIAEWYEQAAPSPSSAATSPAPSGE
jgi:peptidoglycan/xylan/chitin deacetylase (PgdA/CDA1 family)